MWRLVGLCGARCSPAPKPGGSAGHAPKSKRSRRRAALRTTRAALAVPLLQAIVLTARGPHRRNCHSRRGPKESTASRRVRTKDRARSKQGNRTKGRQGDPTPVRRLQSQRVSPLPALQPGAKPSARFIQSPQGSVLLRLPDERWAESAEEPCSDPPCSRSGPTLRRGRWLRSRAMIRVRGLVATDAQPRPKERFAAHHPGRRAGARGRAYFASWTLPCRIPFCYRAEAISAPCCLSWWVCQQVWHSKTPCSIQRTVAAAR